MAEQLVKKRGKRAVQTGVVTSDAGDKTIRVEVEFISRHRLYGKYMRRRTVMHAHDEKNEAHKGDRVELAACRPMSKTKCWRLVRVIHRG